MAGFAGDPVLAAMADPVEPSPRIAIDDVDVDQRAALRGAQAASGSTAVRAQRAWRRNMARSPGRCACKRPASAAGLWRCAGVQRPLAATGQYHRREPPAVKLPEPSQRSAPMGRTRVLTGITTSGTPHLGNYVGAIRPAIAASRAPGRGELLFPRRLPRPDQGAGSGARAALDAGDRRDLAGLRARSATRCGSIARATSPRSPSSPGC